MGFFLSLDKRYVKTVDPPVSDHGGLVVKEARTHLFLEENLHLRQLFCEFMFCLKGEILITEINGSANRIRAFLSNCVVI